MGSCLERLDDSETSVPTHAEVQETKDSRAIFPTRLRDRLDELFSENITAKILRTAVSGLSENVSEIKSNSTLY